MKNVFMALIVASFVSSSFAGECANGVCTAPARPVRKIVNITREVIVAPVRAVVTVATPNRCCSVSSDCASYNKSVTKYQPIRRRLVNRSTNVSCCE